MAQTEHMVANKSIVFALTSGGAATLRAGEKIEASKVDQRYLDAVRSGAYASRARIESISVDGDDGPPQQQSGDPYDPGEHKVDDVIAYLDSLEGDGADEEIARVKEAESQVEGKAHRPNDRILTYERKTD